jgi:lipoate synthase
MTYYGRRYHSKNTNNISEELVETVCEEYYCSNRTDALKRDAAIFKSGQCDATFGRTINLD